MLFLPGGRPRKQSQLMIEEVHQEPLAEANADERKAQLLHACMLAVVFQNRYIIGYSVKKAWLHAEKAGAGETYHLLEDYTIVPKTIIGNHFLITLYTNIFSILYNTTENVSGHIVVMSSTQRVVIMDYIYITMSSAHIE
mmetsp:Transcript_44350/g.73112  ORF Transcript_44350/g.73112 Transcript_44350/m.73112 type:complete len:140 (+) Transcript_44350:245-664(+)